MKSKWESLILTLDEGRETMYLIKIYLSNSVIIEFNCEDYKITISNTTGAISGYCFKNATKSIGFLNKTEIIAITGEKV